MSENPYTADNLTEEETSADEAARISDPARHAILHRSSGQTGRDLTRRLVERYAPPSVADDTEGSSI